MTSVGDDGLLAVLEHAELTPIGRVRGASNATWVCEIATASGPLRCVYKPLSGERRLWDFPDWTITRREVAAYAVARAAGWNVVPPTVWRSDGPAGEGMCQLWIDDAPDRSPVDVVRPDEERAGWIAILTAEDGSGSPVVLVHADCLALQRIAVFDVVVNNADRKGGHLLVDGTDRIWAIDHGVTFSPEDKLRTVLWGWAGQPLPQPILDEVQALGDVLGGHFDPVDRWLGDDERAALRDRIRDLLRTGAFPAPGGTWPAIPWPVF